MAYDAALIARRVHELLEVAPRRSLPGIARELGVDRHTIERALHAHGTSFRKLQEQITIQRALSLLSAPPPRSLKLVAAEMGFASAAALAQFLRRRHKTRHERSFLRPNVGLLSADAARQSPVYGIPADISRERGGGGAGGRGAAAADYRASH